jgi:hypothetical protein
MIFEAPPDARGNDRLLTVCVPSKGRRGASRRPSRCGGPEFPISSGPRRDTLMPSAAPAVRTGTFLQRAWAPVWLQRYGAAEGRRVAFRWQSRAG